MGKKIFPSAKQVELFINLHKSYSCKVYSTSALFKSRHASLTCCPSFSSVHASRSRSRLCQAKLSYDKKFSLYSASKRQVSTFVKEKTHYEILNVPRSASSDEIREAFITLSKIWHPDTNTNDPTRHQKFVQINEAYSVLSKPLSRRDYDLSLDAQKYVARHMSAATSRTYGYGYSPDAGPYYHYKDHVYDEYYWAQDSYGTQPSKLTSLFNFYMLMACATIATVSIIMHYMYNYIPNPKHHHLKQNLSAEDVDKMSFIMQSEQDGETVYYYAIPKEGSKQADIVVLRKSSDSSSDELRMQELTRSSK